MTQEEMDNNVCDATCYLIVLVASAAVVIYGLVTSLYPWLLFFAQ